MVKVILGSRVEVAGNYINVFDAMEEINDMKTTDMFLEIDRLEAGYVRLMRISDNEIILVMPHEQSTLRSLETNKVDKEVIHKQIARQNPERISLWEGERIVMVDIEKIACCFLQKGKRKATVVAENKIYLSNYTLNAFLKEIGENKLIRCHRSFAINPGYLSEVLPGENNTMVVRVNGYNRDIPVSRQYSHTLRSIVGLRTRNDCKKCHCAQ